MQAMNTESKANIFSWLIFGLLFCFAMIFSWRFTVIEKSQNQTALFIPAPEHLKRLSGTFRTPLALVFFMKGVVELAGNTENKIDQLLGLFKTALILDPKLTNAAFLGGVVAPANHQDMLKAIAFLDEAAQLNDQEWRFPYWAGFNHIELENFGKAANYYQKASKCLGAPPFLKFSSVNILSQGGAIDRAIAQSHSLLESVTDEHDKEWILTRLESFKQMRLLEEKAKEFKKLTGEYPKKLEDLVTQGLIKEIPHDTFGYGYQLANPGDPESGYQVRNK